MEKAKERSKIRRKRVKKGGEMKKSRSQKKAELQEASEKLIERLLEWEEKNGCPNLTMMEEEILSIRKAFGEEMLRVAIEGQESKQPVEEVKCAVCGGKMSNKGGKKRDVASRLGELAIERGYYYCPSCKTGVFPPRRATCGEGAVME